MTPQEKQTIDTVRRLYKGLAAVSEAAEGYTTGDVKNHPAKQNFDIVSNDGDTILGTWLTESAGAKNSKRSRDRAVANGYDRTRKEKPVMPGTVNATYQAILSLLRDPSGKLSDRVALAEDHVALLEQQLGDVERVTRLARGTLDAWRADPSQELCLGGFSVTVQPLPLDEAMLTEFGVDWEALFVEHTGMGIEEIRADVEQFVQDAKVYFEWRKAPPEAADLQDKDKMR